MTPNTEFWIQLLVYALSFGTFAGTVLTKLNYLEKRMDKHNQLIERVYCAEGDIKLLIQHNKDMKEVE